MANGWGGARPNSGPKPEGHEPTDFEEQRARHEKIKADQRELALEKERGNLLDKGVVRQASATALAVLMQSLRSLPDNLERAAGLTPKQAAMAQEQVDAALSEVAAAFQAMSGD